MSTAQLSIAEVEDLTRRALIACNTSAANAESLTRSVVASELDGIHSHGLARLPTYCEHARCGKIDGQATADVVQTAAASLMADARDGFAHPAIDAGFARLVPLVGETGVAALGVTNSYNCGVLGYHVETLAQQGLLALGFTNAPASMAPHGGIAPVFGTNPIACAVPDGEGAAALVIDQSSSVVARSELIVHASAGEPIPEGWALDAEGNPTTDPKAGLGGTMLPSGGYKGAGQALIVELLAAALTGSHLGIHASSFADNNGGSPRTGQFFIAIDPARFGGEGFAANLRALLAAITGQDGARIPGHRRMAARQRIAAEGVQISAALHEKLCGYAG